MAVNRYTSETDVEIKNYLPMGPEYHTRAKDYVDNLFVKAAGYDPDTVWSTASQIPWLLKQIALERAMELYAQDQRPDEFWTAQLEIRRMERMKYERNFDKRMILNGNINYENGDSGGRTARAFRV